MGVNSFELPGESPPVQQYGSHSFRPGARSPPPRSPAEAVVTRQGRCSQPAAEVAALCLDAEMTNSTEAQRSSISLHLAPPVFFWMPAGHLRRYLFLLKQKVGLPGPLLHPAVGCKGGPQQEGAGAGPGLAKGPRAQGEVPTEADTSPEIQLRGGDRHKPPLNTHRS